LSCNTTPQEYNFTTKQGATETFTINYTDENGDPVDVSSWDPKMDVRTDYLDSQPTALFTLTDGDGIDMTNADTGVIVVTISATRTTLMVDVKYKYDLELTSGSTVDRIIQGTIVSDKQVTD